MSRLSRCAKWTCLAVCALAVIGPATPASAASAPAGVERSGEYCGGCNPPLSYSGGPVLDTRSSKGLAVTPIYWSPPGTANRFPAGYQELINRYIADVSAASGAKDNVYSMATEYYDIFGGLLRPIRYRVTAGVPVVDPQPLPPPTCQAARDGHDYNACVTDEQLRAELNRVLASRHLPRGLAHFYPVFIPPGVQTGSADERSGSKYCAYHSFIGSGTQRVVFGNEPFPDNGCSGGMSPNHNPLADTAIDNLSHELMEATTDPVYYGTKGWTDSGGRGANEVGDLCSYNYGPPLGSTDAAEPERSEYNQLINGRPYYTQRQFSNYAYQRLGVGLGCQPSESVARGQTAPPESEVAHMHLNASPHVVSARHRGRSSIFVQVWDKAGYDIPGDRISFTTYVLQGDGHCGTVSPGEDVTDGAGSVGVTYRASRSDVACVIVANDALGGRAVSGVVYQGTTRSIAPTARHAFPRRLIVGRRSLFTTSFTNPTRTGIRGAQVSIEIYSVGEHSPKVRDGQIRLSVSRHGRRGPFVPVALRGSTDGAGIVGVIGSARGFTFRGRRKLTLTYRIRLRHGIPRRRRHPILQFQAYLGQTNPASGGDTTLTETRSRNVTVR